MSAGPFGLVLYVLGLAGAFLAGLAVCDFLANRGGDR